MKGSLKKFVLAFFVLALLAVNAMAQCRGKTVYLELPNDWGNRIYILWEGKFISVTATKQGNWSVITLPSNLANDGPDKREIVFSSVDNHYDAGGIYQLNKTSVFKDQALKSENTDKFTCSDFGSDGTYLMEDPARPGRITISTQPPNAYYFYFLPPHNDEWILGTPYLVYNDANGRLQKMAMQIDDARCGWYKLVFFQEDPPDVPTWLWLGPTGTDQVGDRGVGEDPTEWVDGKPVPLNLVRRFARFYDDGTTKTKQLFFVADDGEDGWRDTDPNIDEKDRCSYSLAAIIYDTDQAVNSSFWLYTQGDVASGIAKGIPKPDLRFSDAKGRHEMEFNRGKDGWTEPNFKKAFDPDSKDNVVRCADMPFKRNKNGVWEFNSNKLCKDGTMEPEGNCGVASLVNHTGRPGYMYGYFPNELQTRGDADYSQCRDCDKKHKVESWVPLKATGAGAVSQYCYDRGRSGTAAPGGACGAQFGEGDFRDGDHPEVWDWGSNTFTRTKEEIEKNPFFCFESAPAEFTYEKGQEFFFSGDDDIWIYINNKLVIDLGGTHLAAPGYVNLDTLNLEEGKKYPINVFFCDRRLTMSNVRIATNLYFSQNTGLYVDGNAEAGSVPICLASSGGGNCAAFSGSGESSKVECGNEIKSELEYYLQRRDGTKCGLEQRGECTIPTATNDCSIAGDGKLTCFSGIEIDTRNNKVYVNGGAVKGLPPGSYTVYVKIKGDNTTQPKRVASFPVSLGEKVYAVWGRILDGENQQSISVPSDLKQDQRVVAGKLVPVAFSVGEWDGDGTSTFLVNREVAEGTTFRLGQGGIFPDAPQYAGIKIYEDAAGSKEVTNPNESFKIPASGVLVLYVAGEFRAADSVTYDVNVASSSGPGFNIKVLLPEFRFVNNVDDAEPLPRTAGSKYPPSGTPKDMEVFMGENLARSVVAIDPTTRTVCDVCSFPLSFRSWTATGRGSSEDDNSNGIIQIPSVEMKNGKAQISFYGADEVQPPKYAFFTVGGPSRNQRTLAQWDSLLFVKPPVPYPTLAEIFDRNGDGIGDSIRIVYDKAFSRDSLPNMIEVFWEPNKKDTVKIGQGSWNGTVFTRPGNYDPDYWSSGGRKWEVQGNNSIITIADVNFSDRVKTSVGLGKVEAVTWVTFEKGAGPQTLGLSRVISDKIPAIVTSARYEAGKGCDRTFAKKCRDKATITLSEPVRLREDIGTGEYDGDGPIQIVPFAYKLAFSRGEADFNFHTNSIDLPAQSGNNIMMSWDPSGNRIRPSGKDSVVTIYYNNFTEGLDSAKTPRANDYVRFESSAYDNRAPFVDTLGNLPNPREEGRKFVGEDNIAPEKIVLANLNPDPGPDGEFLNDGVLDNLRNEGIDLRPIKDDLFNENSQIAFLPSKPDWDIERIKEFYPGSAGVLFRPDLASECPPESCDDITFYSKVYYHTNLGNYVVQKDLKPLACDDKIFKVDGQTDCRTPGNMGIYVAWNLKDSKNRKVGTGAYVEVYDFYWTGKRSDGSTVTGSQKYTRKIEMLGVKRVKVNH